MKPDIFLSYSREDQARARQFAESLGREGFTVWWDQTLRSGENYDQVTESALRAAKAVVVLWSRTSVASRWVRAEATLADRNHTLLPVMIEPCERPIMFELTQSAELWHWQGNARDRVWLNLVADVRNLVNSVSEAATPAAPVDSQAPVPPTPSWHDDRPSLAILPFRNRSGVRDDDVFADGMVEDLISALSLHNSLKVIARGATMVYREDLSDLRRIGRELGVRYLMEGNVRRVGGNLRVTAQLVAADSSAILWSQKFDRRLADLADLQEQLVAEVAGQLGVQVQRHEVERALKKPGNLNAWEAVMRAFAAMPTFSSGGLLTSIAEARRAVAAEPDYALGHAVLAAVLARQSMLRRVNNQAMADEACAHADRALALAPNVPVVLAMAGIAKGRCGLWPEVLSLMQHAVSLNSNDADAHAVLAEAYIWFNRCDEAMQRLDVADNLAPHGVMNDLNCIRRSYALFQSGRYGQACATLENLLARNPAMVLSLKDLAVFQEKLGRHEEALATIRRLRTNEGALTLEDLQGITSASFVAPQTVTEANAVLGRLWVEAGGTSAVSTQ
jgi:TolB-like protein